MYRAVQAVLREGSTVSTVFYASRALYVIGMKRPLYMEGNHK